MTAADLDDVSNPDNKDHITLPSGITLGPHSQVLIDAGVNITVEQVTLPGQCHHLPVSHPVNTKRLCNICTMFDLRQSHWADVVQMLYKCFVFTGQTLVISTHISELVTCTIQNKLSVMFSHLSNLWNSEAKHNLK